MIRLSFLLLLCSLLVVPALSGAAPNPETMAAAAANNTATVTVKVENLDTKAYVALVDAMARTNDIGIDYACVEAGILVFKVLNTTFTQRPDVQAYLARKIDPVLTGKHVRFLDVHIEPATGVSKC